PRHRAGRKDRSRRTCRTHGTGYGRRRRRSHRWQRSMRGSNADAWSCGGNFLTRNIKRVSPTCLITFERNRYSVPASFANRPVSLRIYPERLVVAAEGNILCEHERVIERSHDKPPRTIYDWRHYLAVIQRKRGALRNG